MTKFRDKLKIYGPVGCRNKGFSISQIKWIALIAMTIDHLAAYGFEIPVFKAHYETLRIVGRIAALLFFFALTESIKHTRSLVFSCLCFLEESTCPCRSRGFSSVHLNKQENGRDGFILLTNIFIAAKNFVNPRQ